MVLHVLTKICANLAMWNKTLFVNFLSFRLLKPANYQILAITFFGPGNPGKNCQSTNQAKNENLFMNTLLSAIGVYLHPLRWRKMEKIHFLFWKVKIQFFWSIFFRQMAPSTHSIQFSPYILLAFISFIEVLIILFSYQNERNLDVMVFLQLESCRGLNCFLSFKIFKNDSLRKIVWR